MFFIAKHKHDWFVKQIDKLKNKGLTNMDIAHGMGVSYQYISDMIHERRPISDQMVDALINNFDVAEGFMFPLADNGKVFDEIRQKAGAPLVPAEYISLAMQGVDIGAKLSLPLHKIPNMIAADFLMQVNRDCMADHIQKTDIIGIRLIPFPSFYQPDRIYVISTEQDVLIRNVSGDNTSDTISLIASNPNYKAFEIEKKNILGVGIIEGLVRHL